MATHASIPSWRIPWTEEPGGLQSVRSQRVNHDWVTNTFTFLLPSCFTLYLVWIAFFPSVIYFTEMPLSPFASLMYPSSKKNYTFFKSHHQSHLHFSVDVFGPSLITSASLCTHHIQKLSLYKYPSLFILPTYSRVVFTVFTSKFNVSLYQRTIGNGLFNVEETIYCQSVNKGWLPPICQALIRYW